MVTELHRVYSARIRRMACLMKSELAQRCGATSGKKIFLPLAGRRPDACVNELAKYHLRTDGIVLFCHYRCGGGYLLVTVLNNLSGMRVNENLDINPTLS